VTKNVTYQYVKSYPFVGWFGNNYHMHFLEEIVKPSMFLPEKYEVNGY